MSGSWHCRQKTRLHPGLVPGDWRDPASSVRGDSSMMTPMDQLVVRAGESLPFLFAINQHPSRLQPSS